MNINITIGDCTTHTGTKTVHNVVILDKSGSMGSIKNSVVELFNKHVAGVASNKDKLNATISLVTFSSGVDQPLYWKTNVDTAKELSASEYNPSGWTALNDAIGSTLNRLEAEHNSNDEYVVTIITDGMENYSKEFNVGSIGNMINRLEKQGWTITYMGANVDVKRMANDLRININNVTRWESTHMGTLDASKRLIGATAQAYSAMNNGSYSNTSYFVDTSENDN